MVGITRSKVIFLELLFLTVLTCLKKDRRIITVQIPIWDGQRLQGTSCTLRHAATLSAGCYSVGRYPAASQCELEGLPVIQDAGRKMAGPKRGKNCSSFRFKKIKKTAKNLVVLTFSFDKGICCFDPYPCPTAQQFWISQNHLHQFTT